MDSYSYIPTNISIDEFALLEAQIRGKHQNIGDLENTWYALSEHFVEKTPAYDRAYLWTYFRYFTDLSWDIVYTLPIETIQHILVERMIPMACILGINVPLKLSWHIRTTGMLEVDIIQIFLDMKDAFMSSQCIVGIDDKGPKTLQQVIREAEDVVYGRIDTLQSAEFYTALQELMLPKKDQAQWDQCVVGTQVRAVQNLMETISFFYVGKKENIWYLIDSIIYPDIELAEDYKNEAEKESTGKQSIQFSIEQGHSSIEMILTTAQQMDKSHPEAILLYLDEQAIEFGDDSIRDLYYFDEETGTFKWNTDILSDFQ